MLLSEYHKLWHQWNQKPFDSSVERYEKISNSVQEILKKLGLTQKESSTYLFLNKSGSKKAYEIAENQQVARTQVDRFLTVLQNKGLVTMISNSTTKFMGIELKRALKILIDSEKQRLEQINLTRNELCELWKENFYK